MTLETFGCNILHLHYSSRMFYFVLKKDNTFVGSVQSSLSVHLSCLFIWSLFHRFRRISSLGAAGFLRNHMGCEVLKANWAKCFKKSSVRNLAKMEVFDISRKFILRFASIELIWKFFGSTNFPCRPHVCCQNSYF